MNPGSEYELDSIILNENETEFLKIRILRTKRIPDRSPNVTELTPRTRVKLPVGRITSRSLRFY